MSSTSPVNSAWFLTDVETDSDPEQETRRPVVRHEPGVVATTGTEVALSDQGRSPRFLVRVFADQSTLDRLIAGDVPGVQHLPQENVPTQLDQRFGRTRPIEEWNGAFSFRRGEQRAASNE